MLREDGGRRLELEASGVLLRLPAIWLADIFPAALIKAISEYIRQATESASESHQRTSLNYTTLCGSVSDCAQGSWLARMRLGSETPAVPADLKGAVLKGRAVRTW